MYVEDRHGIDELRILARKAKDGRMRSRLLAVALAKGGHTAVHTAEVLGMSRRIVQKWVQRYNEDGLEHSTLLCSGISASFEESSAVVERDRT